MHNIQFDSSFEPVNPAMRDRWRRLERNNVVRAQHWRHEDGPHPTLCLIHGFMGSPYLLNGLWMSLPWFYRSGYDVLLYTLPFHGRRAEKYSPFSGYGYFANGLTGFAEAMAQAVHDFRSLVDYLQFTGVEKIALTGISLGGYTTALIAGVEDRLAAVIPNVPVVSIEDELDDWFPASKLFTLGRKLGQHQPARSSSPRRPTIRRSTTRRWCRATVGSSSPASATGSRRPSRPRCFGITGITATCTGSPATTSCTSASRSICDA